MFIKLNIFMQELLLIFLSRQGFWSDSKIINTKHLFSLIYRYLIVSCLILFLMAFFKNDVDIFLSNLYFLNKLSYLNIIFYGTYIVLILGIFYENFYFIKSNSINTFRIFFRFRVLKIFLLNLFKNMIVTLPTLVYLSFYDAFLPILVFLSLNALSYIFFEKKKLYDLSYWRRQTSNNFSNFVVYQKYLISIIPIKDFVKTIVVPILSIAILLFAYRYDSSILEFSNLYSVFFSGLIFSSIFFSNKLPSFLFLALNKDLPFIKTLQISLIKFVWKFILLISLLQLVITIAFFSLMDLIFFKISNTQFFILLLSLCFGYIIIVLLQMIQALYYKKSTIRHSSELTVYKLPIRKKVPLMFFNFFVVSMYLVLKRIPTKFEGGFVFVFAVILTVFFLYLINYLNNELRNY